ncbi:MAG: hypothetical protein KF784_08205 [Fimbriimonadaceae bacterium]|nr:hypothetical protein [Fimbriimonadaceae bacterium]
MLGLAPDATQREGSGHGSSRDRLGTAVEGLRFQDENYFSQRSTQGEGYNIEGAYAQQGMQDGSSIAGAT